MEITILQANKIRYPDPEAHEPGCMSEEDDPIGPDHLAGYIDLFCSCHRYTEPKILMNGTDVAWPAGWSQDQADVWRGEHNLMPPAGEQLAVGKPAPQTVVESDPNLVDPIQSLDRAEL